MVKDILPKRFCCCIQLKHGVIGLCLYLIFIGALQVIALTGAWNLGYNMVLTVGDLICAVFAMLSILSVKKLKVGQPLKILGTIWLICIILNGVAWQEHIKRQDEIKQKMSDYVSDSSSGITAVQLQQQEQGISSNQNIQLTTTTTQTQSSTSQEEPTKSKAQEVYDDFMNQIHELDQDSLSVIFICWTIFKIYCSLCIMKLGHKIERKHGKDFYYKLV